MVRRLIVIFLLGILPSFGMAMADDAVAIPQWPSEREELIREQLQPEAKAIRKEISRLNGIGRFDEATPLYQKLEKIQIAIEQIRAADGASVE